jgi:hypothetical protein
MIAPALLIAALPALTPAATRVATTVQAEPAPLPTAEPTFPFRLTLQSTSAFGVTHAGFFNQLAGARLDYRFGQRFSFGGALGYANLKGKDHRVHNLLPEVESEYRAALGSSGLSLPLRLSFGFLPRNGPTLRLCAGLSVPVSERVELQLVPLEPMVWMNRERPEVSFNVTLGVGAAF